MNTASRTHRTLTPGRLPALNVCMYVCMYLCIMMGGLCRFRSTGYRSVVMAAPPASSGVMRCEAVLHGFGTSPLERGGEVHQLVTVHTHVNFIVLPHWNTRPPAP